MTAGTSSPRSGVSNELAEIKVRLEMLPEIKSGIAELSTSMREFREEYIREHAAVVNQAQRAHTRIDEVEREVEKLACQVREIAKLMPWVKGMAYILTGITLPTLLAFLVWVWSMIVEGNVIP